MIQITPSLEDSISNKAATTLTTDAAEQFGYLVRKANEELTPRGWQVWYFTVFKFEGEARELLHYARRELDRVKTWERRFKNGPHE